MLLFLFFVFAVNDLLFLFFVYAQCQPPFPPPPIGARITDQRACAGAGSCLRIARSRSQIQI
jgi:hypothetical protein